MIRPLPSGNNWTTALLAEHGIAAGVTIQVIPQGVPTGAFPHRTEDTPIDASTIQTEDGVFSAWVGQSAPQMAATLNAGFAGNLQWNSVWKGARQGVFVTPNIQCNSLIAIKVRMPSGMWLEFGVARSPVT
jgi:hypothetical protein